MSDNEPLRSPVSDQSEWVAVVTLTRLESAYLKPAETRAGRIRRDVLRARMESASGTELAAIHRAGGTVAIREVGSDHGRRILTTAVASHDEPVLR